MSLSLPFFLDFLSFKGVSNKEDLFRVSLFPVVFLFCLFSFDFSFFSVLLQYVVLTLLNLSFVKKKAILISLMQDETRKEIMLIFLLSFKVILLYKTYNDDISNT